MGTPVVEWTVVWFDKVFVADRILDLMGWTLQMSSPVPHPAVAVDGPATVLDVFSPVRED